MSKAGERSSIRRQSSRRAAANEPCDKTCMLLVDDEESIRILFQMIISSDLPDLTIDLAGNGQEALDLFARKHHAVLLMDLHMPVMDGCRAFDAIRQLCNERRWQMPSVVFCTGFAPPEPVAKAVEEDGSHCLLAKPVSSRHLVEAVRVRLG